MMSIYRIDDGGESFWYAANSYEEAEELWLRDYDISEKSSDFTVSLVQLAAAAEVAITDTDGELDPVPCKHCSNGTVPATLTLLEWFHRASKPVGLGSTVY